MYTSSPALCALCKFIEVGGPLSSLLTCAVRVSVARVCRPRRAQFYGSHCWAVHTLLRELRSTTLNFRSCCLQLAALKLPARLLGGGHSLARGSNALSTSSTRATDLSSRHSSSVSVDTCFAPFSPKRATGQPTVYPGDSGRYHGSLFGPTVIPFNNTLSSLIKIN